MKKVIKIRNLIIAALVCLTTVITIDPFIMIAENTTDKKAKIS